MSLPALTPYTLSITLSPELSASNRSGVASVAVVCSVSTESLGTCALSYPLCASPEFPTADGTNLISLGQQCGGYIDPVTLVERGYMRDDGQNDNSLKGFICPLGQICMVITALSYAPSVSTNSYHFRSKTQTHTQTWKASTIFYSQQYKLSCSPPSTHGHQPCMR